MPVDMRAKPYYLDDEAVQWVEDTIASMSLEEKIGNTLCKLLIICFIVSYYVKVSLIHFVISFTISYWRVLAPPLSWCAVS